MDNPNFKPTPDFGEALDPQLLLNFATIDRIRDTQSAMQWWDEHASAEWVGALDNPPVNKKKGV